MHNNRKGGSLWLDFLQYPGFFSSLPFCEETCPSYLLLLTVKVKKTKQSVAQTLSRTTYLPDCKESA